MLDLTNKSAYFYELPQEQIAQTPVFPRDSSRLLFFDPNKNKIEHKHFFDVTNFLKKGDVLVVNNTKVIPARLIGEKVGTETKCEIFLLKRNSIKEWECLVKPGRRLRIGSKVSFGGGKLVAQIKDVLEDGNRIVEFEFDGVFEDVLDRVGQTPLPPYIHTKGDFKERYNTIYAKKDGSSASPTAGLHFTFELLEKIKSMGIEVVEVNLNIGLGTFRPVKEDSILNHKMHNETFSISEEVANKINMAKKEGRRVICVGTTSLRAVESAFDGNVVLPGESNTEIFIYPNGPKKVEVADCLITNFHLPESTLIMLVCAFIGYDETMKVYNEAVQKGYRFFSFGDSCFFVKKKD